ncbi:MAG: N-acetylmuramoyl-L-alanine amidase [Leptolyngbya sp. PLA3]|nr:MAG: N-acetylmuramoyl-L-alanine amidase [Cyanobacteria bacterium CYA]MCE7969903.1 N-acetylmuramoyl-L-alanine amidase [Leptolyngbya sp. PL-A3]
MKHPSVPYAGFSIAASALILGLSGCTCAPRAAVGQRLERRGDEIMVCGQLFHTGTPVVLWTDPGGYDAYRVERRFSPPEQSSWEASSATLQTPNRYGLRDVADPAQFERVRGGGWALPELQRTVDQFVIHYDVCGTSQRCFRVLHDMRGLSVHFMLDLDGTIYQTLDLKERAWHATKANSRSVGIEIANIGAYPPGDATLTRWYTHDGAGLRMVIPGDGGVRTPGFVARPARPQPVRGVVQGQRLEMYDLTDAQYDALIHLTAALTQIFPLIACDYPRDAQGALVQGVLSEEEWEGFAGVLGHFHVQQNKVDPGPAFDWDRVIDGAAELRGVRSRQSARPR